jgi:N-hydroxyarylamine O-acetyltransferase
MQSSFDVDAYLARINYAGPRDLTPQVLSDVHFAHRVAIPYENLDIIAGIPFDLSEEALYEKMIVQHRGGFCYELNILFARLLREMGFRVDLLAAQLQHDYGWGPDTDHAVLLVHLDEPWLADVGNALWFERPLELNETRYQARRQGIFRVEQQGSEFVVWQVRQMAQRGEMRQYKFPLTPRVGADFNAICHHKWTSPESKFTQSRLVAKLTDQGRIYLHRMVLTETINGAATETRFSTEDEIAEVLRTRYGLDHHPARPLPRHDVAAVVSGA